ncbi:MAG: A/G-specific adenine glycosylase [Alphaproteobacteria bacterium]|nr:A/G-specific adenine glycosylase [Alphaproteobacteria bacterium]
MSRSPSKALLDWYAAHGREMPWRVKGGAHGDPYAVWVSEIMLQQTMVKAVVDYFNRWMKRFPTLESLARADIHDVLLMWQGLGYYTRAKKLHECARVLVNEYGGVFPADRAELLKLPGIGPYTASSICCFAFNQPETVVDGNVIRVLARVHGLTHAVTKEEIYALAQRLTPRKHGADYASAIMDLGATICTPANALCAQCPWRASCVAYREGIVDKIPLIQKPEKKTRRGVVYVIRNGAGAYYIRKRPGKGLLSGLYEFPWIYDGEPPLFSGAPIGQVAHVFTHFRLTLDVVPVQCDAADLGGAFVPPADFKKYPFSTLMKRVMKAIR